jgi:hypothetical protein
MLHTDCCQLYTSYYDEVTHVASATMPTGTHLQASHFGTYIGPHRASLLPLLGWRIRALPGGLVPQKRVLWILVLQLFTCNTATCRAVTAVRGT